MPRAYAGSEDYEDYFNLYFEYYNLYKANFISESQLYSLVNTYYFRFAKLFPTTSINNLPDEKLIDCSFNSLIDIRGLETLLIFIIFLT